ncbi:MAG: hypothetical protein ACE144_09865 [Thermodesulfobacteriota bacterium]
MNRKECFGSMNEVVLEDGLTKIQTKPACRDCQEFRDCLLHSKQPLEEKDEGDEPKKQDIIARIIDLSQVFSNEIGLCLLEFLNRIYSSALGTILFRNFLLFYEVPRDTFSVSLSIPISPSTLALLQEGGMEGEYPADQPKTSRREILPKGFSFHIILIQRTFPNNRKANMGLLAHEVARMFSSESRGISQILQTLTDSETSFFKKMGSEEQIIWLMKRWGFQDELEAIRKEIGPLDGKRRN